MALFQNKTRINKGINIAVAQLTVWHWVMFTFPYVNTVVSLIRAVVLDRAVTVVGRIVIQLSILHRSLLRRNKTNRKLRCLRCQFIWTEMSHVVRSR